MQSRRDQLQAHTYILGRLTSALVHAEPDAAETPMRRTTIGWFAGAMVGALLIAGFAVFGLIFGGGDTAWRQPDTLIVQRETGTRYVFAGGALHPVDNLASALLWLGTASPTVHQVSARSLSGVPHGAPVGIVGAPDVLPRRLSRTWLVCATTGPDDSGTDRPQVTVALGGASTRTAIGDDRAVLVSSDGTRYLLWRGQRRALAGDWVPAALGFSGTGPVAVDPVWLNAVPAGADVRPPTVDGRGQAGPVVSGARLRVGQVAVVRTINAQDAFFLVRSGGLAPLTRTQAALVLGDPATAAAYRNGDVTPVPVPQQGFSSLAPVGGDLPADPPKPAALPAGQVPCAWHAGSATAADTTLVAATPPPATARPTTGTPGVTADTRVADRIEVAPDGGALVRPVLPGGALGSTYYLVTDVGVKYPLATKQVAATLGYGADQASAAPASVLALLPTGPALDPAGLRG